MGGVMNRQAKIFEMVASSEIFLTLGTASYLEELRNDQSDPAQQIKMAKALRKRVILLFDYDLSPGQKDELRTFFHDFDTVREVTVDSRHRNWGKFTAALVEMGFNLKEKIISLKHTKNHITVMSELSVLAHRSV